MCFIICNCFSFSSPTFKKQLGDALSKANLEECLGLSSPIPSHVPDPNAMAVLVPATSKRKMIVTRKSLGKKKSPHSLCQLPVSESTYIYEQYFLQPLKKSKATLGIVFCGFGKAG